MVTRGHVILSKEPLLITRYFNFHVDDCSDKDAAKFKGLLHTTTSMCSNQQRTLQWCHNGRDSVSNHQPHFCLPWWRHQMETFSVLLAICAGNSPVTGEFPAQRPVVLSFDVFFDLGMNKQLSKQSLDWWFETPSRSLWRHCNAQRFIQAQMKENMKALRHWLLCREFTRDRWIPRTNGQLRGKCFHLMLDHFVTQMSGNTYRISQL